MRPNDVDTFNLSIQRQINRKMLIEVGYIGRLIRNEFQQIDLDAVPTMTTLNSQSFASAFAGVYTALCGLGPVCAGNSSAPVQPFLESALGGTSSAFCKGFSSCTAAVVANSTMNNQIQTTNVYNFWSTLNQTKGWTLGRTMPSSPINGGSGQLSAVFSNASTGYGNYNAAYVSLTTHDFHGITTRSTLTYGRAMGTGAAVQATSSYTALNPWDLKSMYGSQAYDYKIVYTLMMVYNPPFYRNERGVMGHLLGGWSIAPVLTAHSGAPWLVYTAAGVCQSFGEGNCSTESSLDGAVLNSKYTGGSSPHFNQAVSESASANPNGVAISTNADNGGQGVNMFTNPIGVFNEFRPCILGFDTSCGANGNVRQPSFWNVDAAVSKNIGVWKEGRVGAMLTFQFTNLFNHTVFNAPYMDISDPADFGNMSSNNAYFGYGQANAPRQVEFGIRVHF